MHPNKTILVVHPYKHHVYPLIRGVVKSGFPVMAVLPQYGNGFIGLAKFFVSDRLAKKVDVSRDPVVDGVVWSPFLLQVLRLVALFIGEKSYLTILDFVFVIYLKIRWKNFSCLIVMQDYLPKTTILAHRLGLKVISDQIINQSDAANARISKYASCYGIKYSTVDKKQEVNNSIMKIASAIFVPSAYCLEAVPGVNIDKCRIIPYGIDFKSFGVENSSRDKKEVGVVKIMARANSVRKGLPILLHAIELCISDKIFNKNNKYEIFILGKIDADCEEFYKTWLINKNNELRLSGISVDAKNIAHSEVPKKMIASDIFVMPSLSEGMSFALTEAMASGLPVICTKYCGLDVICDGINGFLYDGSANDLRDAIGRALKAINDWSEIGVTGATSVGKLTWENYSDSVGAAVKNCLSK